MKLFKCQECGQTVFFENRKCERCAHPLGYLPQATQLLALQPQGDHFRAAKGKNFGFRYCANAAQDACNWLVPADSQDRFCAACRHNRTIPDLAVGQNLLHWQRMEVAKHRLFYTLIALGLPLKNLADDPEHGLAFDFLADAPGAARKVLTGHDDGLITINLDEADDAKREKLRAEMGEPYRTLLGHFRHEVGHYFWNVLVRDAGRLEACRAVFGDDSADYGAALQRHYAEGPPADWREHFISAYATAHPWEDFAETWAHYLHIVDTLETASAFGLRIHPVATKNRAMHADIDFDPHHADSMATLIDAWGPLTFAVNSLNRSMGQADLYPFVVSPAVVAKLQFIHEVIHAAAAPRPVPANAVPAKRRGLFGRVVQAASAPPLVQTA
ncbi:MAG: hypothetical protein B7Z81_14235, partial [Acidocella sp. 20-61-6]